jgi:hypothetical protein
MKNALIVMVLSGAACGGLPERSSEGLPSGQYVEALAELENGLAYDGCTWIVRVGEAEYAPTAASRPVIEAYTTNIGRTPARIRYRTTGEDGSVECGWNTTRALPAIELASVSAP